MKKYRLIDSLILAVVGIVFLLSGAVVGYLYAADSQGMVPVEGTIIDLKNDRLLISYQFNGFTYHARMRVSSDAYELGAPFTLLTDPNDPTRFNHPSTGIFIYALGGFGVAMIAIAAAVFVSVKRTEDRVKLLHEAGIRRKGEVILVRENDSSRVNRRSPWLVTATCVHPRTGETVTVHEPIGWKTSLQSGDPIDVLFDPIYDKIFTLDMEDK